MSDIKLIIDAITKNEKSGIKVTRESTLHFFVAAKFKQLLKPKQELLVKELKASVG